METIEKIVRDPLIIMRYVLKKTYPNRELRALQRKTFDYDKKIMYNKTHSDHSLYFDMCKRLLTDSLDDKTITKNNFNSLTNNEIKQVLKQKPTKDCLTGSVPPTNNSLTQIGLIRLENLQYCIEEILRNESTGDLIECGVWRGGACIFMKLILDKYDSNKKVFVADSFKGFPKSDNVYDKKYETIDPEYVKVGLDKVKDNFKKYDVLDDNVVFIEGFFEDSLKNTGIDKLALLRLDADLYTSTHSILINLYQKLVKNGYCIIDDYFWEPCKQAVIDYRISNGITDPLLSIDYASVYWQNQK